MLLLHWSLLLSTADLMSAAVALVLVVVAAVLETGVDAAALEVVSAIGAVLAVAAVLLLEVELSVVEILEVDVDSPTLLLDDGGIDELLLSSPMDEVIFAISSSGWGKLAKLSPILLLLPSRLGRRSLPAAINPRLNLRRRNGDGPFVVDIPYISCP